MIVNLLPKPAKKLELSPVTITRQIVADRIAAYLRHDVTLSQLVDWSEDVLLNADLVESDAPLLADVIGRLGVADVRAFGLAWEDCEEVLRRIGFAPRIEVVPT